eukprot:COSAG02_NODE_58607_length_277_cov_0.494382_1_plen_27_part_01
MLHSFPSLPTAIADGSFARPEQFVQHA